MAEKPRFRRRMVFAKNLGFGVGLGYCNNTTDNFPSYPPSICLFEEGGPEDKRTWPFIGTATRRPASADRTARCQLQAGLRGDVGL